jgi:Flp pilus assembly protein TadB
VTVLTAQGKFSSVVIAGAPRDLLLPDAGQPLHLDPLFHQTLGQVAGIAAIFMTLLGFYVIRRIVTIEL